MTEKLPTGVYHLPYSGKYKVSFTRKGVRYYFGLFDTSQQAIAKLQEVNDIGPENADREQAHKTSPTHDQYLPRGISWHRRDKRFVVRATVDERQIWVGSSDDLETAKQILKEHKASRK